MIAVSLHFDDHVSPRLASSLSLGGLRLTNKVVVNIFFKM